MNITEDQIRTIMKHEGVQSEGIMRWLAFLSLSIAIGLVHSTILYKVEVLDMQNAVIIAISMSTILFAVLYLLDLAYMNLYCRYVMVKEVARKAVVAHKPKSPLFYPTPTAPIREHAVSAFMPMKH